MVEKFDLSGIDKPADAMEKMGMTFIAEQEELMTNVSFLNISTHKAIVRSDNKQILGIVGSGYNPTQFNTYFSQFDTIVKSMGLNYSKGVVYDGGRKVILTAEFEKTKLVRIGDECKAEVNWGTAFDGTMGNTGWFGIERLVCSNGMVKMSKDQMFSCKHTKNSQIIIPERMKILLQSERYFKDFMDSAKRLADKQADVMMVNAFITSMFGEKKLNKKTNIKERSTKAKNQINEVRTLIKNGKGNGQGTAWDVLNGYTEWIDWKRSDDDEKRMVSATIGDGYNKKAKAMKSILSLVE